MRCAIAEPQHLADARNSEHAAEIDGAVMKEIKADDTRFYGTATVNPQQLVAKTQNKRRKRGQTKEELKLYLDYFGLFS